MRNGSLSESHGSYFLLVYVNGNRKRINLGRVERFRSKKAVDDAAREAMLSVRRSDPSGRLTLSEYVKFIYLPVVQTRVRPSTHAGYKQIFRTHIAPRPEARLLLHEYGTHEVQRLLNAIADARSLTTTTLKHIKALLSGVIRTAMVGKERSSHMPNPVHEAVLPRGNQPGDTVAYDLATVRAVLPLLTLPVRAALAIAIYAGLRRSEIQGLHWEDILRHDHRSPVRLSRRRVGAEVQSQQVNGARDPRPRYDRHGIQSDNGRGRADVLLPAGRLYEETSPCCVRFRRFALGRVPCRSSRSRVEPLQ